MASAKVDTPAAPATNGFSLPRLIPSLPVNVLNSINPFASSSDASKQPAAEVKETDTTGEGGLGIPFLRRSLFGSVMARPLSTPPPEPMAEKGHKRAQSNVMFAEPEVIDSENPSREGSVADDTRRRRRSTKPKTSYSLCHPPPASSTRQKLHRRPRSLLQLHKLSADARPVPAFEVIPSANFSVRLVKSITKTYKAKHGLCPNDLVILQAEKYYTQEQDDEQRERDIVALICRGKNNEHKPRITMRNGEEWDVFAHGGGGYEFSTVDDHGLDISVRWVQKKSREGRHNKDRRFNFSTIAAGTRKHPVIATLSNSCLDINDTYKVPDPSASTPLSTPKHGDSILTTTMEAEDDGTGDECVTDDRLRDIIAVTAIFVTFNESWSPYLKEDEHRDLALPPKLLSNSPRKVQDRSTSTPPASPATLQVHMMEKRGSLRSIGSGLLRRSSMLSAADAQSSVSVDSFTSTDTTTNATSTPTTAAGTAKHGRSRSDSNSTVLVHRAASNRRKAKKQATWRPDLLSVKNSVPETSREDLSGTPGERRPKSGSSLARNAKNGAVHTTTDDDETDAERSTETAAAAAIPTPDEDAAKRESSTTTDTTTSEARKTRNEEKRSPAHKKSSRWRKMLSCMR